MKPTEYLVEAAGFADSIWLKAKGERIELDHGTPVVLASECEEAIALERDNYQDVCSQTRGVLHAHDALLGTMRAQEEQLIARIAELEEALKGTTAATRRYVADLERDGYQGTDAWREAMSALALSSPT